MVVFDAQFTEELARKLIAEIRSKTPHPIRFVTVDLLGLMQQIGGSPHF